jgi:uncharacterized membrane protein
MDLSSKKLPPDMELVGKLHPLLVHLPIGFLIVGLLLYGWKLVDPNRNFGEALRPIFLFGAIAALLSCLSGLQLMESGEYDLTTVTRHRNTGIGLAGLSFYFWFRLGKQPYIKTLPYLALSMSVLLVITGHYGGTLTHGSGFLTLGSKNSKKVKKEIVNMEEAILFSDVIQPILSEKCVSCHGAEKQKGNLRLDDSLQIIKGGKNGGIVSGNADDAVMLRRILLPPDDDEHMPPKEKGQLSSDEIALIRWWIKEGHSFSLKVKDVRKDSSIATVLKRFQQAGPQQEEPKEELWPEVAAADPEVIRLLRKAGIAITPISNVSNLLSLNLLNLSDSSIQIWEEIRKLREQVVILKADLPFMRDEHLKNIHEFTHLRKISLTGSQVTDEVIQKLSALAELRSVNISNSQVTYRGLEKLVQLEKLRYLYAIQLKDSSYAQPLAEKLPNVEVLVKPFEVPILVTDTTEVVVTK